MLFGIFCFFKNSSLEMAKSGYDILITGTALPQIFMWADFTVAPVENPEVYFLSYFNQRNVSVNCVQTLCCVH